MAKCCIGSSSSIHFCAFHLTEINQHHELSVSDEVLYGVKGVVCAPFSPQIYHSLPPNRFVCLGCTRASGKKGETGDAEKWRRSESYVSSVDSDKSADDPGQGAVAGRAGAGTAVGTTNRDDHSQHMDGDIASDMSSPMGSEWLSEGTRMVDEVNRQGAAGQEAKLDFAPSADGLEAGRDVETEFMMSPASRAQRAGIAPLVNLPGATIKFHDMFALCMCS